MDKAQNNVVAWTPLKGGAHLARPTLPARVTVVETVYYQRPGRNTEAVDRRYSRALVNDEQAYRREFTVDEQWAVLDTGWVNDCHLLELYNDEPHDIPDRPRAEDYERARLRAAVIGILPDLHDDTPQRPVGFSILLPGSSMRLAPFSLGRYRLKSVQGVTRLSLFAVGS